MTFVHWLVVLSAVVSLTGGYEYIHDTIYGHTRPNLVTWSLWALALLIGVFAALSAHADPWVLSRTFLAGFIPLMVVVAALTHPHKIWKVTTFDVLCGLFSILALVVWLGANSPVVAVALAALADLFAALPTITKAWKFPGTETGKTFLASMIAVLLVLPAIPVWNIQNVAFPAYLVVTNSLLLIAIYGKRLGLRT